MVIVAPLTNANGEFVASTTLLVCSWIAPSPAVSVSEPFWVNFAPSPLALTSMKGIPSAGPWVLNARADWLSANCAFADDVKFTSFDAMLMIKGFDWGVLRMPALLNENPAVSCTVIVVPAVVILYVKGIVTLLAPIPP